MGPIELPFKFERLSRCNQNERKIVAPHIDHLKYFLVLFTTYNFLKKLSNLQRMSKT